MYKKILTILFIALCYFVAGKIGLLLAIPPGYATAIWPASGIALASTIIFGRYSVIGVFLGSFILNLELSISLTELLTMSGSISTALIIGFGAMSHCLVSIFLIKKFATLPKNFTRYKEIIGVVVYGGLISCMVSATIGILSLYSNYLLTPSETFSNWLTWWFGDAVGVCIFTPIILILYNFKGSELKKMMYTVTLPLMSLLIIFIFLFFIISNYENEKIQSDFQNDSKEISEQIIEYFNNNINLVNLTRTFIEEVDNLEYEKYQNFSKKVRDKNLGIRAIGWAPKVTSKNLKKINDYVFKNSLNKNYIYKLKNKESVLSLDEGEVVYPVIWVTPENNKAGIGFDVSSEENRKETLDYALKTNSVTSSTPLVLVNEADLELRSVFLATPVIKKNIHIGYVIGVFDLIKLVDRFLNSSNIKNSNFVITQSGKDNILYYSSKEAVQLFLGREENNQDLNELSISFTSASKTWEIWFYQPKNSQVNASRINTWLFLAGGVFFTALFGALLLFLSTSSSIINKRVLKRTEDLKNANELIKEIANYKTEFLSNMSHEIRTPLNGVLGLIQLIDKDKLSSKNLEYMKGIEGASRLLQGIINDLLDFEKIESGNLKIVPVPVNIIELFSSIIYLNNIKLKDNNNELIVNFDESIPEEIIVDDIRVGQVFMNFLSNAIKFTHNGKIEVNVSVDSSFLEFSVQDSGIGISDEAKEILFHPFKQADSSITKKYGGTGLGLSICKKIVELLEGKIYFESSLGKGSLFGCKVPVKVTTHKIGNSQIIEKLPIRNILIVEDNKLNQKILASFLDKFKQTYTVAENGQEAIDLAESKSFDLIFMDIQMPILDGIQATRIIREKFNSTDLVIVGFSANIDEKTREICKEAGMNDFIEKPVSIKEVKRILKS